jgi:hypothetical protein
VNIKADTKRYDSDAFLDSSRWEDAVRKSISLGGDADTMACISGGIAQAFYKKIPESITNSSFLRDRMTSCLVPPESGGYWDLNC